MKKSGETISDFPFELDYRSTRPLRTLLRLVNRPGRWYAWVYFVFLLKHCPAWLLPIFMAKLVGALGKQGGVTFESAAWLGGFTLLMSLLNVPLHTYYFTLLSASIRRLERNLRATLVAKLQQLSFSYHERTESGRIQSKVLRDVEGVTMLCRMLSDFCTMLFTNVVFTLAYTLFCRPSMLLVYLVLGPICLMIRHVFHTRIVERNKEFRSGFEQMSSDLAEMITMLPVTRAHGVEEAELGRIVGRLDHVRERGYRLDRIVAIFGASHWMTGQVFNLAFLLVTGWMCWRGQISIGDVVLYNGFFNTIVNSLAGLVSILPQVTSGMESLRSVGEVLECPDVEQNEDKRAVTDVKGRLDYDHVNFSYPESIKPAVRDFSLEIAPGECVAFVGESGSGKSTLMNLTIGFRRPTSGRILLDGVDMDNLDLRTYRRFLSVVSQRTLLFSGTIRENITYGLEGVDETRLMQAIEAANVAEFLDDLPDGLETMIGEHGSKLSGGQGQRVAIARALIRDPRILILDEATSSLDVASEKLVQEAIDRLVKNRTTLIVAHRLSTIRHANRIVALKDGACVEVGTPEELMKRKGEFYRSRSLQV